MVRAVTLSVLAVVAVACSARSVPTLPSSEPTPRKVAAGEVLRVFPSMTPAPLPSPTLPEPTSLPTKTLLEYQPPAPPTPISATSFFDFPGNLAKNETAPDFTARLLDGESFVLSQWQEGYLLLVPTVVGCGDCLFSMQEISGALRETTPENVRVFLLNVYAKDPPDLWQDYADFFSTYDFLWGVVDSPDFVIDYEIESLGAFLLIDPQGQIVFRSYYPLPQERIEVLFALAANEANPLIKEGAIK